MSSGMSSSGLSNDWLRARCERLLIFCGRRVASAVDPLEKGVTNDTDYLFRVEAFLVEVEVKALGFGLFTGEADLEDMWVAGCLLNGARTFDDGAAHFG